MYRFGDSTAFPLAENVLETLTAAVDCCVELFRLQTALESREQAEREVRQAADSELRRLDQLQSQLEQCMSPMQAPGAVESLSSAAARQIVDASREVLSSARRRVLQRRDESLSPSRHSDLAMATRRALAGFWLGHQLPGTQWSFHWKAQDEQSRAELCARTFDFEATFLSRPHPGSLWARPIAVGDQLPGLEIETPGHGRRRPTRSELLTAYEVVEMTCAPARQRFVLRRPGRKDALVLSLADSEVSAPFVARVDENGEFVGDARALTPQEVEELSTLWMLLSERRHELLEARCELTRASLANRCIENLDSPVALAEHMLGTLAAIVREIRMRSRVPGELILKRELGKGRREEIFLPRNRLQERFASLPDHHRRHFEAMGLGTESTVELVERIAAPPARKLRSPRVVSKRERAVEELDDLTEKMPIRELQGFRSPTERVHLDGNEDEAA